MPARVGALGQLAQLRGRERVVVDRVAARRWSRRAAVSAPSSSITSNFASARRRLAAKRRRAPPRSRATAGRARSPGPSACAAPAHLGRRVRRADQVVLEQLDRVEARPPRRPRASPRACRSGRRWRSSGVHTSVRRQWAQHAARGRARAPVNSSSEPAACSTTIAAAVERAAAALRARRCSSCGLAAAGRRRRRPTWRGSQQLARAPASRGGRVHADRRRVDDPVGRRSSALRSADRRARGRALRRAPPRGRRRRRPRSGRAAPSARIAWPTAAPAPPAPSSTTRSSARPAGRARTPRAKPRRRRCCGRPRARRAARPC